MPKYQKIGDFAKDYSLSVSTCIQLARKKNLNCIRVGGLILVNLEKPFLTDVSYNVDPRRRLKGRAKARHLANSQEAEKTLSLIGSEAEQTQTLADSKAGNEEVTQTVTQSVTQEQI